MFRIFSILHTVLSYIVTYAVAFNFQQEAATAMLSASSLGQTEVMKLLLSHPGVDANLQDQVTYKCISASNCMILFNIHVLRKLNNRMEIRLLSWHPAMDTAR